MPDIAEISTHSVRSSKLWNPGDVVDWSAVFVETLPSYDEMFCNIILKNQLCVIGSEATAEWISRRFWVTEEGLPNFDYIKEHFGHATAPVADCSKVEYNSHVKLEMTVSDFMEYWKDYSSKSHPQDDRCLYLKDWHFTRDFPTYNAYKPPAILCSDWLNEFWQCNADESCADDYKFVYFGPRNSWTPFHADVLNSYSWSANICGRKKWIFYPPGQESALRDQYGQLIFDLRSTDLDDPTLFPLASQAKAITIIQKPGEIIFVPSGWHHQVFNMEDTISINHNWTNGCGAHLTWAFLKKRLSAVQKEIADCRDMEDWHIHCQLILKSDSGIDYQGFFKFMSVVAQHRINALHHLMSFKSASEMANKNSTHEERYDYLCLFMSRNDGDKCFSLESQSECWVNNSSKDLLNDKKQIKISNCEQLVRNIEISEEPTQQLHVLKCPHWSHCGRNLALFDLQRVRDIVTDMIEQTEFKAIQSKLVSDPHRLLQRINTTIQYFK